MNRINKLFQEKKDNILSVYFTCGYPELNDTSTVIKELVASGVDLIEVGIPFSDPVADGPVIQKSSEEALKNGISLKLIFEQLADIRKHVNIPLVMMGYLNPALQYGLEAFCAKCEEIGIDGVILPDLTPDIYNKQYRKTFEKHGLSMIFLTTPQTTDERFRYIDSITNGFIYMVSDSATTGAKTGISDSQKAYFERVKNLNLKNPRVIGFGISNNETFTTACHYAHGAIIGSAFIKALQGSGSLSENISGFVKGVLKK